MIYVYEFAEDHDLPLIIYLPADLSFLKGYRIRVGLVNWKKDNFQDYVSRGYYLFSSNNEKIEAKVIYGSQSPYSGKTLIEAAKEFLKSYDPNIAYYNVKSFLKI